MVTAIEKLYSLFALATIHGLKEKIKLNVVYDMKKFLLPSLNTCTKYFALHVSCYGARLVLEERNNSDF